ncbi:MAG: ABC transporter substrate-binding protein [Xanthobacteraceae bacterium]
MRVALATCLSLSLLWQPANAQDKRDTLTVAFGAESTTLDPNKAAAGVDYYFIGQMFEQLLRRDPNGNTVNWLAKSYDIKPEGAGYVVDVELRDGVKFHNGDPLTSEDFEFAYQRARDPKVSRLSHLQASVSKFEIVDPLRFKLHFSEGDATYISDNLRLWAIPKKYFRWGKTGSSTIRSAPARGNSSPVR